MRIVGVRGMKSGSEVRTAFLLYRLPGDSIPYTDFIAF